MDSQKQCISCGKCKANCEFLSKYQLDFSDRAALKELAYHCMLCGTCTRVCPIGIDGRNRILDMRRGLVSENHGKIDGYQVLRGEKVNYKFRNYKRGQKKSVLFLGCNYPSLFPQTTEKLMKLMEANQIGVVFDCCGKPISELGLEDKANTITAKLNAQFRKKNIEELIVVCPNCYYYLKDKIDIPILTIYEKLVSLDIKTSPISEDASIFMPCPDKNNKKWLQDIEKLTRNQIQVVEGIQCCGLGGVAVAKEPKYPEIMAEKLKETKKDTYVYCASCAGSFTRNSVENVEHILNAFVGSKEVPDIKYSMINRMKYKFK